MILGWSNAVWLDIKFKAKQIVAILYFATHRSTYEICASAIPVRYLHLSSVCPEVLKTEDPEVFVMLMFVGQTQAINLTQNAHKPQTIVLANTVQLPRPGTMPTSVAGVGGQKSSGL